jgi:uncharacterized membrane protein
VRGVYAAIKQVVSTIVSQQSTSFREVVLVQWPRAGMWTIGFVTGTPTEEIQALSAEGDMVGVYVPTTPNPTSGYLMWIERRDIVPMAISVEEGIKLVVSCGIVTPTGAIAPPRNGLREVANRR